MNCPPWVSDHTRDMLFPQLGREASPLQSFQSTCFELLLQQAHVMKRARDENRAPPDEAALPCPQLSLTQAQCTDLSSKLGFVVPQGVLH